MARQGKFNGNLKGLHEAPHGSIFIKYNGVLDVAGLFAHERGIAEYNHIHTASRPNLEVSKERDLFTIKHYGPKSVHEFNAEDMYERWLRVISEGNGVSSSAKR
jgi:hypothetical protein